VNNSSNGFFSKVPVYKRKVIRNETLQFTKPIILNSEAMHDDGNESVEPMIENGQVVGVIHHCSCGKITEIRFQLDESMTK
jgi:hypothetical protein